MRIEIDPLAERINSLNKRMSSDLAPQEESKPSLLSKRKSFPDLRIDPAHLEEKLPQHSLNKKAT
jgi:hypothetical protein